MELITTIHVSRRTFSKTFFWKISLLFWFSDFEQNSCKTFSEMLAAIFSELTSFCPKEQIEKTSFQVFYGKFRLFLSIPDLEQKPNIILAKVVSASLSKMTVSRPEKLFEENNFSKTFTKVTCFWIWAKNVWQDGQTAFTCPVELWWKVVLFGENESFFVVSAHCVKHFRNTKQNWQGCQFSFHHLQSNFLRKT